MIRFGPEYWDKNGLYRAPVGFILVLVLLLRPYILWLLTVATRREDLNFIAIFYPLKQQFFVALSIAVISLVISLCYILRRPNASQWPKYIWRYARWLLLINVMLDLAWSVIQIQNQYFSFSTGLATQLMLLCWAALYLIKSRYLSVYFAEWPELESKSK
jgi:predicted ferric reductase